MKTTKKQRLIQDSIHRYKLSWGNFKSDRWKSYYTLRAEVADLMAIRKFSKKELIEIKNFIKKIALEEMR
jgi:hypothetical protein